MGKIMNPVYGIGKITVLYKDETERFCEIHCKGIEVYGLKLAFSDESGDLIRNDDGKIEEVSLSKILKIEAK